LIQFEMQHLPRRLKSIMVYPLTVGGEERRRKILSMPLLDRFHLQKIYLLQLLQNWKALLMKVLSPPAPPQELGPPKVLIGCCQLNPFPLEILVSVLFQMLSQVMRRRKPVSHHLQKLPPRLLRSLLCNHLRELDPARLLLAQVLISILLMPRVRVR
jgi:hypothetical protein